MRFAPPGESLSPAPNRSDHAVSRVSDSIPEQRIKHVNQITLSPANVGR